MLFSGLVLCLTPFLPETPRWLAENGRTEEARQIIARLEDKPVDHVDVDNQLNEIREVIAIEQEAGDATWSEVFTNSTKSRNLHRVILGMGPYMMNQWSGISKCIIQSLKQEIVLIHHDRRALLLPRIHPRKLPWLQPKHGPDSRFSRLYSIRHFLLATVLLH